MLKGHLKVKVFTVISFLLNFCMIREHLPKKECFLSGMPERKHFFLGRCSLTLAVVRKIGEEGKTINNEVKRERGGKWLEINEENGWKK